MEAFDEQADHLVVARDIVYTDQFRSHLKNFSSSARMLRFVAKDRGPVRKPLGQRGARQSHPNGACNLGCCIGPQQQRPACRAIDKLIARLEQLRFQTGSQDVEVLEGRKNNLIVAPSPNLSE